MTSQRGYTERQIEWMNNTQAKVGDKVLVVDKVEKWGCSTEWYAPNMDYTVGQVGEIINFDNSGIIVRFPHHTRLDHPCGGWWYPFFVLVKVEDNE